MIQNSFEHVECGWTESVFFFFFFWNMPKLQIKDFRQWKLIRCTMTWEKSRNLRLFFHADISVTSCYIPVVTAECDHSNGGKCFSFMPNTKTNSGKQNNPTFKHGFRIWANFIVLKKLSQNFCLSQNAAPRWRFSMVEGQQGGGIQDFAQGDPEFCPPRLSPKFAQNRGFPLKVPENCMILKKKKNLGGPWIRSWADLKHEKKS